MNCEEVSKHLTEYLDKSLDTAMTTRVATHVISCALCRAEANELADCIHQVATLPVLDAPLGFAQRVMAHVHDLEPKASLWQRLMLPLTNRVPVQATAVAVIAISAIALYQKEQPSRQNSDVNLALRHEIQTPVAEKQFVPAKAPSTAANDRAIEAKRTAATNTPLEIAKTTQSENSVRAKSSDLAPAQPIKSTAPAPASIEPENSGEAQTVAAAPKRPPLRVQEVTTARDSSMFNDPRGFSAPFPVSVGVVRQSESRPIGIALERTTFFGDRVADFEFTVRRRSPQRHDPVENLSNADALQKSSETENLASRSSTSATPARARIESIAEIRFYNVAAEHFEIFKKDLAAEANIESEPKTTAKELEAAKQADRQLLVKVTILPPESSSNSR
jgi:hypothetical protein